MGNCFTPSLLRGLWIRRYPITAAPYHPIFANFISGQNLASVLQDVEQRYQLQYKHVYLSCDDTGLPDFENEVTNLGMLTETLCETNTFERPLWIVAANQALLVQIPGTGAGRGSTTHRNGGSANDGGGDGSFVGTVPAGTAGHIHQAT